ncbi:MAG: putative signal transducing protein [Cyclobacteriaceae bacterium]|jgi:hypothetical protein
MEEQDRIVVLEAFNTAVMANLAKTKLDAFDIPCFLTDEHFNNLYPFRNELIPGVRLFVFEHDVPRAREILMAEE